MDGDERLWLDARGWAKVAALWAGISIAWTPATLLIGPGAVFEVAALGSALLLNLIHFAPWALSVPWFLALARRFPIGVGPSGRRHVALFALLSLAVVPLFTAAGTAVSRLLLGAAGGLGPGEALAGFWQAVLITGLFAFPTYLALVAIGQTMAFVERDRRRERLLSKARADALRVQVAPHFLFNALNAISALGYSDPAQADRAMVRLAALLRATLERPERTSLRDELMLICDQVELHRLLLGDRLTFDLEVEADAWKGEVPALLLQPLVENALVHGLSRLPEGGRLTIVATRDCDDLIIEIANDAPARAGESPRPRIGIANVEARLAVAHPGRSTLDFGLAGGRARTVLRLPFVAESS
ncbi:sensor histidine kinase [Sphingosinicella terrae]|uniref:sensor histidine kinase n=1 Tax=Sphingosinicella terrae TaxID=2172047 RepID=UPI0013B3CCA1|nr:histidine kinase [Sphingosinicella terrae]